jgi:UDP-N-acetylmuramate--alanine ligase
MRDMFSPLQALHFTGIGGIGMSALARLAAASGLQVSGSDLKASRATEQLAALGITVAEGHAAGNVPAAAQALIVTTAAAADNPEIAEARRRVLPIATRGELLGALMRRRRAAAVAGSHGKTTVTSLLTAIALEAGIDPTAAVGAFLPALGNANARLGAGSWFIAESDESDGSFLQLHPEISVLTNIDREHLDHYGSFENVRSAFVRFINQTSLHGAAAVCLDDDEVRATLPRFRCRLLTYGQHPDARLRLLNARAHAAGGDFEATLDGRPLGAFHIPLLGAHNLLNAAAALSAACLMGIEPEAARRALAAFSGPSRRLEFRGEAQGITVVDDYGHHPTEVRATLAALRLLAPRRLVVLFQPHRYTRTQALLEEFATAFHDAHAVRVLDIYAASEPPLPGLDAGLFARRLKEAGHPDAVYAGSVHGAAASTLIELRPGDLVLTLGAGSVTEAGPLILKGLREVNPHG